jgi:protein-S-isoprenylcysteine O-methyltransferase Ste14
MSTVVLVLRFVALLAVGGPMLIGRRGRRPDSADAPEEVTEGSRLPVLANFAAFGLFFALLCTISGTIEDPRSVLFGLVGTLLALSGAALVVRSRPELGAAWSFVPRAAEQVGIVTTGPYAFVRHPIYLGLSMLALGEAIAFSSSPAVVTVVAGVVPTFVWRARVEERVLCGLFGDRYRRYQERTKMLIPYLL